MRQVSFHTQKKINLHGLDIRAMALQNEVRQVDIDLNSKFCRLKL